MPQGPEVPRECLLKPADQMRHRIHTQWVMSNLWVSPVDAGRRVHTRRTRDMSFGAGSTAANSGCKFYSDLLRLRFNWCQGVTPAAE
jgi:hypothetical protein